MKKLLIIISILCIGIFSYAQLPSPTSHQTLNNGEQMGVFRGKLNTNGTNAVTYMTLLKDSINHHNLRLRAIERDTAAYRTEGSGGGTTLDSLNLEWGEIYGLDHYIVLKKADPSLWDYALDLNINWSGFEPNGKGFKFIFDNGSAGLTSISSNNKFISFRDTSITISTNLTNNLADNYERWVFGPTYIWKEKLGGNRRLAFYDELNSVSSVDSFWYSDDNGTNGRLLYPKLPYTNIVLTNQASWIGSSPRMLTLNNNHNSCDIFQINNLGSGSSAIGFNLQNGPGIGFYLRNTSGTGLLLDDINTDANGLSIRHFPSTGYGLQITGTTDNILFKVKNDSSIFGNELILKDSLRLNYIDLEGLPAGSVWYTNTSTGAIDSANTEPAYIGWEMEDLPTLEEYEADVKMINGHMERRIWYIDHETKELKSQYGWDGLGMMNTQSAYMIYHEITVRWMFEQNEKLAELERRSREEGKAPLWRTIASIIIFIMFMILLAKQHIRLAEIESERINNRK